MNTHKNVNDIYSDGMYEFLNNNNVWRSQHLRLESMMENELGR